MTRRRELAALFVFGLMVAAVAAAGIGVRATYGAQTTADEPQYLLTSLSIWEDGNLDISDELADERYRQFHEADLPQQTLEMEDGRRISPHDPLLPLLLAVPMGLGGWVAAKAFLALIGGALASLMVWTAHRRFGVSRSTAFLTVALFALAPPLVVYSTQVYPEISAGLALVAGLAAILGPFERRGRIVFCLAVIALPWLAVKYVPVAACLAIAGLSRAGKGRRAWLLTILGAAGVGYVFGHLLIYDGLTAYAAGDHFVAGEFTAVGSDVNLWGRSTRLIGLIVDRGFGIGAWQPALLLLPLVAGWALGRRAQALRSAVALVGVGWLVATFVALTMQGWWFPGRQLVVVLPIAVILFAAWVDRRGRFAFGGLLVLGLAGVVGFGFLVVEGLQGDLTWVVDFASTSNPFYRALGPVLPDYMDPTANTWILHGLWTATGITLAFLGWRSASEVPEPPRPGLEQIQRQERVFT